MNRLQVNKEFENLVKYNISKGGDKIGEKEYKELLEWSAKTDLSIQQKIKKTDYAFYIITFLIIFFVVVTLLLAYYTEKIVTKSLDSLLDDKNKSAYIEIEEYDNEELYE